MDAADLSQAEYGGQDPQSRGLPLEAAIRIDPAALVEEELFGLFSELENNGWIIRELAQSISGSSNAMRGGAQKFMAAAWRESRRYVRNGKRFPFGIWAGWALMSGDATLLEGVLAQWSDAGTDGGLRDCYRTARLKDGLPEQPAVLQAIRKLLREAAVAGRRPPAGWEHLLLSVEARRSWRGLLRANAAPLVELLADAIERGDGHAMQWSLGNLSAGRILLPQVVWESILDAISHDLLRSFWREGMRLSPSHPAALPYAALAKAAVSADDVELFEEVVDSFAGDFGNGVQPPMMTWRELFLQAKLLEGGGLSPRSWTAQRVAESLRAGLANWMGHPPRGRMPPPEWAGLAAAAATADFPAALAWAWNCAKLRPGRNSIDFPYEIFAAAAAQLKLPQVALEAVEGWAEVADTRSIGKLHSRWCSFLHAGIELQNEAVCRRTIDAFEAAFDPIYYPDRKDMSGVYYRRILLDFPDWPLCARIRSIWRRETLDRELCWRTLQHERPAAEIRGPGRRFEGAAGCLQVWLANRWINAPDDFPAAIGEVAVRLQALADNGAELRRWRALHILLIRGRGAYSGALQASARERLAQSLAPFGASNEAALATGLAAGTLKLILQAWRADKFPGRYENPDWPENRPDWAGAIAAATALEANIRDKMDSLEPAADQYEIFGSTWECLRQEPLLPESDWEEFIGICVRRTHAIAWDSLERWIASRSHNLENTLDRLADEYRSAETETERTEALKDAADFLALLREAFDLGALGKLRSMNLGPRVRSKIWVPLVRLFGPQIAEPLVADPALAIAVREGLGTNVLESLFEEVVHDVRKALLPLSPDERQVRIMVRPRDDVWAEVTIENTRRSGRRAGSSTGRGTSIMPLYAAAMRLKGEDGKFIAGEVHRLEDRPDPGWYTTILQLPRMNRIA